MKKNRIMSLVLAVGMIASCSSFEVSADSTASVMNVETNTVIKTNGAEMYGISTDWSVDSALITRPVATESGDIDTTPNLKLVKGLNEYKLPLVRLGEEASRTFQWKQAIGPMENRADQSLWGKTGKISAGPLETVRAYETVDSDAAFTVTLNVENDTAQSAADFAEFLTGGTETEWGGKRAEYGHAEPVNVKLFELGNEVDHGDGSTMDVNTYIEKCKAFITAIKDVAPDAKFAVQASTGAYGGAKNNSSQWREWHKAILADKELAPQIDCIALHAYFYAGEAGRVMENCVSLTEGDIKAAGYDGRIKAFISEYALWFKAADNSTANPHDIAGITETSDVISRMAQQPGVEMMTYHGLNSSYWANIVNDTENDRMYLNGIGNLLKLYKTYGVGDVLKTTLDGFETGKDSDLTGIAVKNSNGNISYIFTNKSNTAKTVAVNTGADTYKIKNEMRIVSNRGIGTDDIAEGANDINVNSYTYSDGAVFTEYSIPAYSVCAVETYNADKTVEISESFTYEENFDGVADGKLPEGWSVLNGRTLAGVEGGELVVEPSAGWTTAIVRIPDTENTVRDGLTLEADMTLADYNTTTRNGGARNKAGFAYMLDGNKTSSYGQLAFLGQADAVGQADIAESGVEGMKHPGTDNTFVNKTKTKLKLVFKGNKSPIVYINGTLYVGEEGQNVIKDTTQNTGGIGIMANDAKVRFDNVKVSGTRIKKVRVNGIDSIDAVFKSDKTYNSEKEIMANIKVTVTDTDGVAYDVTDKSEITSATENGICTVTVKYAGKVVKTFTLQTAERGFRFEEDFNSIPDGDLNAEDFLHGMKIFGNGKAWIKDGALHLKGSNDWKNTAVLFDMEKVSRFGLEIECDIKTVGNGASNVTSEEVGLLYAVEPTDGKIVSGGFSKIGLYAKRNGVTPGQQKANIVDGEIKDAEIKNIGAGNTLQEGGTVRLKMMYTKGNLDVYFNGQKYSYNKTCNAIDSGYVGVYAYLGVEEVIDNLVISGTETVYADTASSITKMSDNAADGTVSVSVSARSAGLSEKSADIIAAVYEKESGKLISVSGRKTWDIEKYPIYRTSLDISGIDGYSADKYTVKVFALDGAGTLKPLVKNIEF